MLENRDEILKMDDAELSRLCELEFFKGTGNGGQKRNKISSAARARSRRSAFFTPPYSSGRATVSSAVNRGSR